MTMWIIQTNSSSLWKIINRAIPSKDIQGPAFTKDTSVLADELNQFFAQVGPNAAKAVQSLRRLEMAFFVDVVFAKRLKITKKDI